MPEQQPYQGGNRLPVPSAIQSPHFLYLAKGQPLASADVALVTKAVLQAVEKGGMNPAQIDVMTEGNLRSQCSAEAADAFKRLKEQALPPGCTASVQPVLLFCEWASIHEDSGFSGSAFVSYVLHTGPNPYIVQSAHTQVHSPADYEEGLDDQFVVKTSTRVLKPGSVLVMDPTTPHYAVPAHMHQDQLLITMQLEVSDETLEEREQLLKLFPPVGEDRDNKEIFDGFGL